MTGTKNELESAHLELRRSVHVSKAGQASWKKDVREKNI